MRKLAPLVVIALLAPAEGVLASEYIHPKLKSRQTTVKTVIVLPPLVTGAKSGVKGSESLIEEAEGAAQGLAATLETVLRARGLTVSPLPVGETADPGVGDELRQTIANLQTRYDALLAQLARRPKDVNKGRYTLGDLLDLPPGFSADALVFTRAQGITTTKGKGFLSGGLMGMALAGGQVGCDVAVIDMATGDVLFFSRSGARSSLDEAAVKLQEPLAKSFKKFPTSS